MSILEFRDHRELSREELQRLLQRAAELLRSVPGPMHPTTYDQYWQEKVEQWLKDAEGK